MVAKIAGWPAIIAGQDSYETDHLWIFQPGADTAFNLVQGQVGGNHRWQTVDIAIVDNLKELFLSPRGGVVSSEVIQHEQPGFANLVEPLFEAGFGVVVAEAQGIEQVGHSQKQSWHAHRDREVGDSRCQVGLAAAIAALQDQPAMRRLGKTLGLVEGSFERIRLARRQANPAARLEAFESEQV